MMRSSYPRSKSRQQHHQHQKFKANKCKSIAVTVAQYGEMGRYYMPGNESEKGKF